MGLRAAWRGLLGREVTSGVTASADPSGPDTLNNPDGFSVAALLGRSKAGAPMSERTALTLPAVLRAMEILTGVFAMTPLIYYRSLPDGGKERATSSPLYRIFRRSPNAVQSAFQFKEAMLGDLLMAGGFFAFNHRDDRFQLSGLTRLDPYGAAVNQHWDRTDGHSLFFDVTLPNGARERLSQSDCWHVPGFSRDGLIGLNRIRFMDTALTAAAATSDFAARFWENNAQPSTLLKTKGKVTPEDKAKIRTDWLSRFRGSRAAGDVAVLDQELEAQFLSHDNRQSQFIEARTFAVLEVARAFGVPPHLLFELSRATFSNIDHQSLEFIIYCMSLHYERVAAAATHAFAEEGHFFEFLPEALLKGDIKARFEAYGIAIDKGIYSPNEVRRRENENSREGGDEYRVGSGSTLEGQGAPAPRQRPSPPPRGDEEDDD